MSICYERVDDLKLIYTAGKAFGELHRGLAGFDASKLGETIPQFHDTPKRYRDFLDAKHQDLLARVNTCLPEIAIVESFKDEYGKIMDGIANGEITYAVTHNDPKINNILFEKDGNGIKAVIDLDTIMPGSYLFDFGDALRSLFTGDNEDSEDLDKLVVNFEIFKAYAHGYLSEMLRVLTPREIELLPFSAFLLSIECGMRFLEDYLRGDVYFKTKYPTHNLVRARTQLTLAKNIFHHFDSLKKIVDQVCQKLDQEERVETE
ncbi:MAG: phosphotransferase enzyme family protein [Bacilli bacterium]|jgi:N-acetylhexosamine 1-kinase